MLSVGPRCVRTRAPRTEGDVVPVRRAVDHRRVAHDVDVRAHRDSARAECRSDGQLIPRPFGGTLTRWIAALACAWVMAHPSRPIPLIGSQSPDRVREIARALGVTLSRGEWYQVLEAARGDIPTMQTATDLTDAQWALLEPMLPKLKPTGLVPPMPWTLVRALRFCANVQGRQLS